MPKFESSYILLSEEYIPSMKKKFPFETSFASEPVKIFSPSNEDIYLAKAGIDSLKPFLDSSIDLEKNYDLIGVAFNAFVVNRVNKNDQVISTESALAAVENFKFKPMNIEHKRKEVVGMITGYGFSEFGTDKPLTIEEVKDKKEPFNVVLSGFVWRVVDSEFADKLEDSSDPSSLNYLSVSTSWEMGFKDFSIAKGGKNLNEAEIISNQEDVDSLKAKLTHFGGDGKDSNGDRIYLNLKGEVLPLGIGFTMRPAADVKGVKVAGSKDLIELNNHEVEIDSSHLEENDVKNNISANSIKNTDFNEINKSNKKDMIIKSINDLTDDSLKQIAASDIKSIFEEEIKKASEKFSQEKEEKDKAFAEVENSKKEIETKLAEITELSQNLQNQLDQLKSEAAAKAKEELFQNRMAGLDEEFELEAEEREIVGEQIKDLDEEGFEKWYKAFNVFAKGKNKKMKMAYQEKSEKTEEKEMKASEEEIKKEAEEAAAKALETAKASDDNLPNASSSNELSIRDKFAKAFNNETVKVQVYKI
jgi:hypothetical protein